MKSCSLALQVPSFARVDAHAHRHKVGATCRCVELEWCNYKSAHSVTGGTRSNKGHALNDKQSNWQDRIGGQVPSPAMMLLWLSCESALSSLIGGSVHQAVGGGFARA